MIMGKENKEWYLEKWEVVEEIPKGWKLSSIKSPMPYSMMIADCKPTVRGGLKILRLTDKNIDEVRRLYKKL